MFELTNLKIKDSAPDRVYVFPERLTKDEIEQNVKLLHTIANEESDRTIFCFFDEIISGQETKFEVCFPIAHLDFKKYNVNDFRIIERDRVASGEFKGDIEDLRFSLDRLGEYAKTQGYNVKAPFRYLFILHKKPLLSKQPQKFTLEIQASIEKT